MFKKERGITLVALVITIVVLLILSGVTIASVGGSNNIFTKAQKAKTDYEADSKATNDMLSEAEAVIDQYTTE